eukprot:2847525-Rhodomonas_salina.2
MSKPYVDWESSYAKSKATDPPPHSPSYPELSTHIHQHSFSTSNNSNLRPKCGQRRSTNTPPWTLRRTTQQRKSVLRTA